MALLVAAGCAEPPIQGTNEIAPPADPSHVSSADFDDWPFVPSSGTLSCVPSGNGDGQLIVTIYFGGTIEYALNGLARDVGFRDLDTTVMPDWPDELSLGPIIERGLALCG